MVIGQGLVSFTENFSENKMDNETNLTPLFGSFFMSDENDAKGFSIPSFESLSALKEQYKKANEKKIEEKIKQGQKNIEPSKADLELGYKLEKEWKELQSFDDIKIYYYNLAKKNILEDLNLRLRDEFLPPVTENHERVQIRINVELDDLAFGIFKYDKKYQILPKKVQSEPEFLSPDMKEKKVKIERKETRRHSISSSIQPLTDLELNKSLILSANLSHMKKSKSEEIKVEAKHKNKTNSNKKKGTAKK